jgi:hypothetical protein
MSGRIPKALILFHRHGHRAPAKNIVACKVVDGKLCADEHALWESHCDIGHRVDRLDDIHPVTFGTRNGIPAPPPHDLKTYPFGNLTNAGISFLEQQARDLCKTFPVLRQFPLNNTVIHSTNFKRTQISAQVVWNTIQESHQDWKPDLRATVPIIVPHPSQCNLSFFDRASDFAAATVKEVQRQPQFQASVHGSRDVTAALTSQFPRLGTHRTGFDWMGALDYYSCRRGHGLDLEPAVAHLESRVYSHIIDRFSMYLTHPQYLTGFMGPLLKELCALIEAIERDVKDFRFHVFSGHDINLLGLICLLRATSFSRTVPILSYDDFSSVWPDFGTTMVMEVLDADTIHLYMNNKPFEVNTKAAVAALSGGSAAGAKSTTITLTELKLIYGAMAEHLKAQKSS